MHFIFRLFYKPNVLCINCACFLLSTSIWHTTRGFRFFIEQSVSSRTHLTLRLFVVHSALLLSSVYSARILEEFHLIRSSYIASCHPLKDSYLPDPFHQRTVLQQTNYSFSLPLRDREVANNFTISCPSIKHID